ncbi:MAG TPA: phosphoribosylamine--glycine ligase [Drouetiella sp.]
MALLGSQSYLQKVLVIGGGGREHAICWKLAQSKLCDKVYCAPGNGGTALEGKVENVPIAVNEFDKLAQFAVDNKIDLVVVGPDNPLADGIVDRLEKSNLVVFGPTKDQSKLEWSKAHAKQVMDNLAIPTPRYVIARSYEDAKKSALEHDWARVVKVDGLALGKGVFVCDSQEEVLQALAEIFENQTFGDAGRVVLLEEKIDGEELSLLMLCDGKHLVEMPACQDHKRRFDDDKGPNTGGMGAYSPVDLYDRHKAEIQAKIFRPLQKALAENKLSFKGVLYAGIIVSKAGPQVLEFNARFGDPETQALLPRMKSDLLVALFACATGELDQVEIEWVPESSCCVVAVGDKYPASSSKGETITFDEQLANNATEPYLFHAGTKHGNGGVITDGGRVLSVVALAPTMEDAAKKCYEGLNQVSFKGMEFRKDIARRAFKQCHSN